jgi:pyruvate formate lyase activating enzyme
VVEARLYQALSKNRVRCDACAHHCVIAPGERGHCGVRENRDGTLYSLVYGRACALHVDPIEKKPLYHFMPGTQSLSMATVGCQFTCKNCQNWQIAQGPKGGRPIQGEEVSPDELLRTAQRYGTPSISYTYTDPNVYFEYALDTMQRAQAAGIRNAWVTSGFWTPELFELIRPYLDAANIDLKAFDNDTYRETYGGRLQPVLDTLKRVADTDIELEVTTLVIPGVNDSEEQLGGMARFIAEELGRSVPWHISRFSGTISWKMQHLPDTPPESLEHAKRLGGEAGLRFVYLGNVGFADTNTYCPDCGALCVKRNGYRVVRHDDRGRCPSCGAQVGIKG